MNSSSRPSRIAGAIAGALMGFAAGHAGASAFALMEQNASTQGNAQAGMAAAAEDASTVFFNPAGLTRLNDKPQVVQALHFIYPPVEFNNSGSLAAALQPLGGNGGNAGAVTPVPNVYGSMPLNRNTVIGIGINAPFGLKTEYDDGWLGRYLALKSEVKTINVNPSIGYKVNDMLSIGAGVSYQRLDAELTNAVNYSGALATGYGSAAAAGLITPAQAGALSSATAGLDARAGVTGSDSSWGWNVGALINLGDATRIGLAYRSKIEYAVTGDADFNVPSVPALSAALAPLSPVVASVGNTVNTTRLYNGPVSLAVKLPDSFSLSLFHRLDARWDIMADASWTGWSSIPELRIIRSNDGSVLSIIPENFDDTWRVSIGANYRYSDKMMFRFGVAYDESPVNSIDRSPRLPDENRTWLASGLQYRLSPQLVVDVAGTYIFVKEPRLDLSGFPPSAAGNGLVKGTVDSHVGILSAQLTYTFK